MVNPLASMLAHYGRALTQNLEAAGITTTVLSTDEPSASGGSRLRWLASCYRLLFHARLHCTRHGGSVILAWPMLGYVDVVCVRLLFGWQGFVVLHDPDPLVRAVGYGRILKWLARRLNCLVVTHSDEAARVVARHGLQRIVCVPHPVLDQPPAKRPAQTRSVYVLGQYKPDRDIDLMESLARELPDEVSLRVAGRGWPEVPGWSVDNRFISEGELQTILSGASTVVLVPYRRFFQSGIAMRALENLVPVVGPMDSSLAAIFGSLGTLPNCQEPQAWVRAIDRAFGTDGRTLRAQLGRQASASSSAWKTVLRSEDRCSHA
ncbi:hypothetical protein [Streptomyces olivochromogenes]|uniref:hypothetical protein n=1 Tax=Streptomyces olivochromogenes TaxID=1963 RepID=UPI001F2356C6|nr:hypothetical protein [Streptomyces olivochromogenes]MCF3130206.1 hypothetical protein [Streptomyces olivochromogenes]